MERRMQKSAAQKHQYIRSIALWIEKFTACTF
jgi:hypothetical protein